MNEMIYSAPLGAVADLCLVRSQTTEATSLPRATTRDEFVVLAFVPAAIGQRYLASKNSQTAACILADSQPALPSAVIEFAIRRDYMSRRFSALLERKVFRCPVFSDINAPPSLYFTPIVQMLGHYAANRAAGNEERSILRDLWVEKLANMIALNWPNNYSSELRLPQSCLPPRSLRLALDFIWSKRGVIDRAGEVAEHTHIGLRALERIFDRWLGIGIAAYCKRYRLSEVAQSLKSQEASLAELAKEFHFSNLTRLRRELATFNEEHASRLTCDTIYNDFARTRHAIAIEGWAADQNPELHSATLFMPAPL